LKEFFEFAPLLQKLQLSLTDSIKQLVVDNENSKKTFSSFFTLRKKTANHKEFLRFLGWVCWV
jgi:hypothetical protein